MTRKQRNGSARYLYDLSKVLFATTMIGNLLAGLHFDVVIFVLGAMGASASFYWAFTLDAEGD